MLIHIDGIYRDQDDDLVKIIALTDHVEGCVPIYIGQFVGTCSLSTYDSEGKAYGCFSATDLKSQIMPGEIKWQSLSAREQHAIDQIALELSHKKITAIRIIRTLINSTLLEAKTIIEDLQVGLHGGFTRTKKDLYS